MIQLWRKEFQKEEMLGVGGFVDTGAMDRVLVCIEKRLIRGSVTVRVMERMRLNERN